MIEVKVLMALTDDELPVGKNHAYNGEWIDITMRKDLEYGRYGVSKVLDTAYRGFLGIGTTFDIFQNILFPYSLNTAYRSSWIWRTGSCSSWSLVKCRHRYAVSSLMDTPYWLSEQ
ncbi:hypothetical protein Tco_0278259 [Tanacetum coccineum]